MREEKNTDYATKREIDPEYVAVKVTWWNGRRWYVTYEVEPRQRGRKGGGK
jgi:hypothetical protein